MIPQVINCFGELLEWAVVYNNYYGTPKKFVLDNLEKGTDVLLEIDIQGALKIKNVIPDGVFIFVLPPSVEELGKRLNARGKDSQLEIERRLACYDEEIAHLDKYDYMVVNDNILEAAEKIRAIITAERCRVRRMNEGYFLVPPSLKDLMKISDSKYAIVVAVAKRARMLSEGKRKEEDWRLSSMVTTALEEFNQGKFKITYKKRTTANE